MKPKVLIVAADEIARRKYIEAATAADAACRGVPSLKEMHALLLREPFNGVLIDLHESTLTDGEGRQLLNLVEATYPVAKARINPKGGITALVCGRKEKNDVIHIFVDRKCREFKGRRLRANARKHAHFNVLLALKPSMEDAVRTFTVDACRTGCFVFLDPPKALGDTVWIRLAELGNAAPIEARVVRIVPWGIYPMQIPGVGLAFVRISEDQRKEIAQKL